MNGSGTPERNPGRLGRVAAALAAPASGLFWVNALVPRRGYRRHVDLAYGAGPRRTLDVYAPERVAAGRPVVVFFYGGSWQSGEKRDYRFVGQALAAQGITAVIPDYRLYPEVAFPAFVADGAGAVAWTRRHIAAYGESPDRIFVAGHSAGAHIGAMLAVHPDYLAEAGDAGPALAGFIGLAGPYDFLPIRDPVLQRVFGPRNRWPESQPIRYVSGGEPPMLLMHGTADTTVAPHNTTRLAAAVTAAGGVARCEIKPGVNHVMILAPLAAALRFRGDQRRRIADFVRDPEQTGRVQVDWLY